MVQNSRSSVLKKIKDSSSGNDFVACKAFVELLTEYDLLDADEKTATEKIASIQQAPLRAAHKEALEEFDKQQQSGYIDAISNLDTIAANLGSEDGQTALDNIIYNYSNLPLAKRINRGFLPTIKSILLNGLGAGFGLIVVYLLASTLTYFELSSIDFEISVKKPNAISEDINKTSDK